MNFTIGGSQYEVPVYWLTMDGKLTRTYAQGVHPYISIEISSDKKQWGKTSGFFRYWSIINSDITVVIRPSGNY